MRLCDIIRGRHTSTAPFTFDVATDRDTQAERDRIARAERDWGRPTRGSTPEERGDR